MFAGLEAPSHWLILAAVGAVFFGYKRLPDAAGSLGRSLRVFRKEIRDDKTETSEAEVAGSGDAEVADAAATTEARVANDTAPNAKATSDEAAGTAA